MMVARVGKPSSKSMKSWEAYCPTTVSVPLRVVFKAMRRVDPEDQVVLLSISCSRSLLGAGSGWG